MTALFIFRPDYHVQEGIEAHISDVFVTELKNGGKTKTIASPRSEPKLCHELFRWFDIVYVEEIFRKYNFTRSKNVRWSFNPLHTSHNHVVEVKGRWIWCKAQPFLKSCSLSREEPSSQPREGSPRSQKDGLDFFYLSHAPDEVVTLFTGGPHEIGPSIFAIIKKYEDTSYPFPGEWEHVLLGFRRKVGVIS